MSRGRDDGKPAAAGRLAAHPGQSAVVACGRETPGTRAVSAAS
jgi:hypothetical protein